MYVIMVSYELAGCFPACGVLQVVMVHAAMK